MAKVEILKREAGCTQPSSGAWFLGVDWLMVTGDSAKLPPGWTEYTELDVDGCTPCDGACGVLAWLDGGGFLLIALSESGIVKPRALGVLFCGWKSVACVPTAGDAVCNGLGWDGVGVPTLRVAGSATGDTLP